MTSSDMDKVGIIVQARMGSTRLPGKVMRPLLGRPMIDHIVERLRDCRSAHMVILATSDLEADTGLADHAAAIGVTVFRGSETDVLDRYYCCAKIHRLDHVVRATGDNPFVDADEADSLIKMHISERFDYSSSMPEAGGQLPIGSGLEVMTFAALETSWQKGREANHREHVNEFILENPALFRLGVLVAPKNKQAAGLRLTVDTEQDFARAEGLLKAFDAAQIGERPDTAWLISQAERI